MGARELIGVGFLAGLIGAVGGWGTPAVAADCAPLECSEVAVDAPYSLDFNEDHGGILDGNGVGTGFTYIDPPDAGGGYVPDALEVAGGVLKIRTGPGIQWRQANALVNGLGVGIPSRGEVFAARTTLIDPPRGTRRYEQAGVWLGSDQDNYVKLVLTSPPTSFRLEFTMEIHGRKVAIHRSTLPEPGSEAVSLLLRRDTRRNTVGAWYATGSQPFTELGTFGGTPDLGRAEPTLDVQGFAGIFATHRRATSGLTYRFDDFSLLCHLDCDTPSPGDPGPGTIDLHEMARNPVGRAPGASPNPSGKAPGARGFRATALSPRKVAIATLLRGVVMRVRCSETCRAGSRLSFAGRVHGAGAPPRRGLVATGRAKRAGPGRVRLRLKPSPPQARKLRRRARSAPGTRVRLSQRTTVTGPGGQRVRIILPLIVKF
jgi:hypothetical protein